MADMPRRGLAFAGMPSESGITGGNQTNDPSIIPVKGRSGRYDKLQD